MIRVATSVSDLRRCYSVLRQLHPQLSEAEFIRQMQRRQSESGYTLVFISGSPLPAASSDSPLPAGGLGEVREDRNNPNPVTPWHMVPGIHWQYAREMRREPTQAEQVLWKALSARQLGYRFRRQHPLGPFIADFYCAKLGLVIEVDGETHQSVDAQDYDRARDEVMRAQGLTILRLTDADVLADGGNAMDMIKVAMEAKTHIQTSPYPPAGRGESNGAAGGGEPEQVCVCAGFRVAERLAGGKIMYVDDFVMEGKSQAGNAPDKLFDWLVEHARQRECLEVHFNVADGSNLISLSRLGVRTGTAVAGNHLLLKL